MRYQIAISNVWYWLFVLFGWSRARSYVDVDATGVHIHFGSTREHIPHSAIAGVRRRHWPWYFGLGAKLGPGGGVSYVGSTAGVVQIDFAQPRPMPVWGPVRAARARCVILSLEEADRFIADMGA